MCCHFFYHNISEKLRDESQAMFFNLSQINPSHKNTHESKLFPSSSPSELCCYTSVTFQPKSPPFSWNCRRHTCLSCCMTFEINAWRQVGVTWCLSLCFPRSSKNVHDWCHFCCISSFFMFLHANCFTFPKSSQQLSVACVFIMSVSAIFGRAHSSLSDDLLMKYTPSSIYKWSLLYIAYLIHCWVFH